MHAFAKFKRPECTRLHLRELQSLKFSQRNSLEKSLVRSPDGRYCALIATIYYISRPHLSQNLPSAPGAPLI